MMSSDDLPHQVASCLKTAVYLRDSLSAEGITCQLNDLSSTVILERPADERFVKRWQLACEEDIAHVVVMPNVTTKKVRNALIATDCHCSPTRCSR